MFHVYSSSTDFMEIVHNVGGAYTFPYAKTKRAYRGMYKMRKDINWGCAQIVFNENTLNRDLSIAVNKVKTFNAVHGLVYTPMIWTRMEAVNSGLPYLGRSAIGSCGKGIVKYDSYEWPKEDHDFYVQFIPRQAEYRIHVFCGEIIARQVKEFDKKYINDTVINFESGKAVFKCSNDLGLSHDRLIRMDYFAKVAVERVGLDFGAVDFLEARNGRFYFLEVNSAPGTKSPAMQRAYSKAIRKHAF